MLAFDKADIDFAGELEPVGVADRLRDMRNFVGVYPFRAMARQSKQYRGIRRMAMPGKRKRAE